MISVDIGAILRSDPKTAEFAKFFEPNGPQPGDGAVWSRWVARDGHVYGYNTTADALGKWYAIDYAPIGKGARGGAKTAQRWKLRRMVKCATRSKAKAKASRWYHAAEAPAR